MFRTETYRNFSHKCRCICKNYSQQKVQPWLVLILGTYSKFARNKISQRLAFAFRSPARALAAGLLRQDHVYSTTDESFVSTTKISMKYVVNWNWESAFVREIPNPTLIVTENVVVVCFSFFSPPVFFHLFRTRWLATDLERREMDADRNKNWTNLPKGFLREGNLPKCRKSISVRHTAAASRARTQTWGCGLV